MFCLLTRCRAMKTYKCSESMLRVVGAFFIHLQTQLATETKTMILEKKNMHKASHSSCKIMVSSGGHAAMPFFGLHLMLLLSMALLTTSCHKQDKISLLQFLAGLSHENGVPLSWKDGTNCCGWEGITCDQSGAVIEVSLPSRSLKGSISPSLGELTSLLRVNLSYNLLSGALPSELMSSSSIIILDVSFNYLSGRLKEPHKPFQEQPLQALNISSNLFTGELTSTMWEKMRNLVTINASNNSFQGWIPSSFCISSPTFAVLDLSYNQFSGSIPANLGKCSALRVLKVGHNNLSGTLPDELFHATLLQYLSFPDNGLHGILSGGQIINLKNLLILDLGGNRLQGKIPDSIGQLKQLEEIHLDDNNMSGELPSSLSNCTNIRIIDLKSNSFSGELQRVNFSNLPCLETFDLLYNNFIGTIPESIYSCRNLTALRLSGNNLHGQLSPKIGNLKSLVFLSIGSNNFTNITHTLHILKNSRNLNFLLMGANFKGEIMPEDKTIDGFPNLRVLSISECSLSGTMSLWLSKLKNLEMLFLQNNQLTGPIPVYLGHSLQYRRVNTFPKTLDLSHNKFTGVIPLEIVQLKLVTKLNFSFNSLSGEIPQQLGNLTSLQVLDLSSNHLTGGIPLALNNLHFLSKFNVSHNDLEGPIPSGGQISTFPSSSFDGNPKLCGIMVAQRCISSKGPPKFTLSTEHIDRRVAFAIAFGTFFAVGVLYDQIVLSRYFG